MMPSISSGQIPGRKRILRTAHITEREDQRAAQIGTMDELERMVSAV